MHYVQRSRKVAFSDPFHANGLRYRDTLIKLPYATYVVDIFIHLLSLAPLFPRFEFLKAFLLKLILPEDTSKTILSLSDNSFISYR